ncbi:MAG TPA: sugar phosphate isomerase/epimerase [Solibacterales bacterium]|nr:sugar phosphate isomerase/epimerase [Bryobacterales bacterium]
MKLGLINSAWLGSPIGTADGIRLTREIGFDTIDIFTEPMDIDVRERKLIKETAREVGLPIMSLPCCALGIADFNAPVRRFHVARAKGFLDLAYELEARNLLLVLGEYLWQQEVIAPRDQWNWAVEHTRELGEYAQRLGLEIALELEPFHLSLINDLEKMLRFLDDVNHAAVRANLDISHLHLSKVPAADIAKAKGRIAHVHFSDCDGQKHGDLPPGRGVVDFPPYLAALKATGFDGVVSIELEYSPEPGKIVEWVREAYTETDKLMRAAGIRS